MEKYILNSTDCSNEGVLIGTFEEKDFVVNDEEFEATESTTRFPLKADLKLEKIEKLLKKYKVSKEDVLDHCWKNHGPETKDRRDPNNKLQSWFYSDNIEVVTEMINKAKDEVINEMAMWLNIMHINGSKNGNFENEVSFGNLQIGEIRNNKTNVHQVCNAIHVSFRCTHDNGSFNLFFINAFPVEDVDGSRCRMEDN